MTNTKPVKMSTNTIYIHGYSERETQRLNEQSGILEQLLHSDSIFKPNSKVLEAGCGVGAQTIILARRNPDCSFVSVDISTSSLEIAQRQVKIQKLKNVAFEVSDLRHLPYPDNSFDYVFVCFVLEHIDSQKEALFQLHRVLKPGGKLHVIEGDHGATFWHPETPASLKTWQAFVKVQQSFGHDPLIGRKLTPVLSDVGFKIQNTVPKWVYTDATDTKLRANVIDKIIAPMTATGKSKALELGLIDNETWVQGLKDIQNLAVIPEGTFFYSWFQSIAQK